MSKRYDLAVKVREYQDRDGQTKAEWKNIGVVMQGERGFYMLLDRTFNPAGVPDPQGKGSVLVSMFEPRDDNRGQQRQGNKPSDSAPRGGGKSLAEDLNDEIPFAAAWW